MATIKEYLNTLNIASYKGINFIWRSTELSSGRETKAYEHVGSEGDSKVQDLGKKKTTIIANIEPIDQTILAKNQLLAALVDDEKAGELILPDYSSFNVVCTNVKVSNAQEIFNQYSFEATFELTSELTFPLKINSIGSLNSLAFLARLDVNNSLLDRINNFSIVRFQGNILSLVDDVFYDFPNNNAVLSAINNVNDIIDTTEDLISNEDETETIPLGASGEVVDTPTLDDIERSRSTILSRIVDPESLVNVVGNIYNELATLVFTNIDKTLNLFETLANLTFPTTGFNFDIVQDKNALTLEHFNRKLALLAYCVNALKKEYKLQEEINNVIDTILILQLKLLNYTRNDLIEITEVVNSTLDILKTQKSSLYRIDKKQVNKLNSLNLTYILFNDINNVELEIIKDINPNLDYGNIDGEINILVNNF